MYKRETPKGYWGQFFCRHEWKDDKCWRCGKERPKTKEEVRHGKSGGD